MQGKTMFGLGVWELLLILLIVLVVFGAGRLPQIGAGIGKGIRNFKKSIRGEDEIDISPTDKEKIK
jgi:sec-independent protein translocase protein TatA